MYNLSKDLLASGFFSICFLYLLLLFIIISYATFFPNDNPHAVSVETGMANIPIPVRLNVIELDVVAIRKIVSNDFKFVVNVL